MTDGMHRTADRGGGARPARAVPGGGRGVVGTRAGRIDWDGLMRLGLGALRLPPDQFWSMTPVELTRALEGAGLRSVPSLAIGRRMLETLMEAHPDRARSK